MGAMKKIEASLLAGKKKGKRAGKTDATEKGPEVHKSRITTPIPEDVGEGAAKGGRTKLADMTPKEKQKEIDELLADLKGATDVDEKKRIRRSLRARGHRGGLGKQGAKKETKETAAAKA